VVRLCHLSGLMNLTDLQQSVSDDSSRFRVIAAGRRWGKSWLSMNELAKFCVQPNQRALYVAPTYRQAKTIMWDELKNQIISRAWHKKINESELKITLINNSTISIRSTDNYDALRGGKYNFIVMDECADMAPEAWYQVLRPTLSDTLGDAMFITSPKGRNWVYDLWNDAHNQSDWSAYQFTTLSGGNVPESEIQAAIRDLDDRAFKQEYLAEFVDYAGVIFYAFDNHHIKSDIDLMTIDSRVPLRIGLDFNNSPICSVVSVRLHDTIHILDEIQIYQSNTDEMVSEIQRRYPNRKIIVYPDATGARTNTNSRGVSDHIILQNAGFKLITGRTNPVVADTIVSVNSAFKRDNITIHPSCKHTIDSIRKYSYKDNTRQPDKTSGHDHFADALRYLIHHEIPVKKANVVSGKHFRTA